MSLTRPTQLPDFCTNPAIVDPKSGQNNVVAPDPTLRPEGWQFEQIPPRGWMNWLHNLYYNWIEYLDHITQGSSQTLLLREYDTVSGVGSASFNAYFNKIGSNCMLDLSRALEGGVLIGSTASSVTILQQDGNPLPAEWNPRGPSGFIIPVQLFLPGSIAVKTDTFAYLLYDSINRKIEIWWYPVENTVSGVSMAPFPANTWVNLGNYTPGAVSGGINISYHAEIP